MFELAKFLPRTNYDDYKSHNASHKSIIFRNFRSKFDAQKIAHFETIITFVWSECEKIFVKLYSTTKYRVGRNIRNLGGCTNVKFLERRSSPMDYHITLMY